MPRVHALPDGFQLQKVGIGTQTRPKDDYLHDCTPGKVMAMGMGSTYKADARHWVSYPGR